MHMIDAGVVTETRELPAESYLNVHTPVCLHAHVYVNSVRGEHACANICLLFKQAPTSGHIVIRTVPTYSHENRLYQPLHIEAGKVWTRPTHEFGDLKSTLYV